MRTKIIDTNRVKIDFRNGNKVIVFKNPVKTPGFSLESLNLTDGDTVDINGSTYTLGMRVIHGTDQLKDRTITSDRMAKPPRLVLREIGFLYT